MSLMVSLREWFFSVDTATDDPVVVALAAAHTAVDRLPRPGSGTRLARSRVR
jgi:hypothetical protein